MKEEIVNKIFDLRSKFVIIGLTGKTGSGCSTVASMLGMNKLADIVPPEKYANHDGLASNDERKYNIVHHFLDSKWHSFTTVKASDIIMLYALQYSYKEFESELKKYGINFSNKDGYQVIHEEAVRCMKYLQTRESRHLKYDHNSSKEDDVQYEKRVGDAEHWKGFIFTTLKEFVDDLRNLL